MTRFKHDRIRGSLWTRGRAGIVAGAAILAVLLVRYSAIRWFFFISLAIGLVMVVALHLYHRYAPVKDPEEDRIVLHLKDDDNAS